MKIKPVRIHSLFLLFFILVQIIPADAQSREKCDVLTGYEIHGMNIRVTRTEWRQNFTLPPNPPGPPVNDVFPPHCHIEGEIDKRSGHDGKLFAIGFALNLPADWNGKFMFQGGGGLNGSVREPLGLKATGKIPALSRGFAVASTDSGHRGTMEFDASFLADQEAAMNFYYLAIEKVTVAAKKIIADYYGREPGYSYFVGCSTGGREGMIMSQRYPFYYDGIVSGAPAIRTGLSNLALKWISVLLNQVAKRDDAGKIIPGSAFTDVQRQSIIDAILKSCDADDGITDGLVFDTLGCRFDPDALMCQSDNGDNCITTQQAEALKEAFSGPKDSRGFQVYPGFPFDTGINAKGKIPGLLRGGTSPVDPTAATATEMDVDAEALAVSNQGSILGDSTWTNLTSFSGNGGKLIFYHGVSDAWFSVLDTIRYYEEMSAVNGGMEQVRDWSRAFLVPGMTHCDGGESLDNFDMVSAIVEWVENAQPPERVISTGIAFPGRSRPLCPYPDFAYYRGVGDPEDAANFECRD